MPVPQLDLGRDSAAVFRAHFQDQTTAYGSQMVINLVNQTKDEGRLQVWPLPQFNSVLVRGPRRGPLSLNFLVNEKQVLFQPNGHSRFASFVHVSALGTCASSATHMTVSLYLCCSLNNIPGRLRALEGRCSSSKNPSKGLMACSFARTKTKRKTKTKGLVRSETNL